MYLGFWASILTGWIIYLCLLLFLPSFLCIQTAWEEIAYRRKEVMVLHSCANMLMAELSNFSSSSPKTYAVLQTVANRIFTHGKSTSVQSANKFRPYQQQHFNTMTTNQYFGDNNHRAAMMQHNGPYYHHQQIGQQQQQQQYCPSYSQQPPQQPAQQWQQNPLSLCSLSSTATTNSTLSSSLDDNASITSNNTTVNASLSPASSSRSYNDNFTIGSSIKVKELLITKSDLNA